MTGANLDRDQTPDEAAASRGEVHFGDVLRPFVLSTAASRAGIINCCLQAPAGDSRAPQPSCEFIDPDQPCRPM